MNMILPNNGKVVIIDDKPEQVKNLMSALSKDQVSFCYYQDEAGRDLPKSQLKNIRLVFLDLMLEHDITPETVNPRNIVSSVFSRLMKLISKNNGPYFLIIWSTESKRFADAVLQEFEKDSLSYLKPFAHLVLDKIHLNNINDVETVKNKISDELSNIDSMKGFFFWESLINDSAGDITNGFTSLIENDDLWNENTKNLLYKMSSAYYGKKIIDYEHKDQLIGAYSTLNHALLDQLEINVQQRLNGQLQNLVVNNGNENEHFSAKMNEQLHLSYQNCNTGMPGSTYMHVEILKHRIEEKKIAFEKHIESINNNNKIPIEKKEGVLEKAKQKGRTCIDLISAELTVKRKDFNEIINSSLKNNDSDFINYISKTGFYIETVVTPLCDHSQKKVKMERILPGVLIPSEKVGWFDKKRDYNYISDFSFRFKGTSYVFLFDFRYLYGVRSNKLEKLPACFRVKEKLVNEIQVKLSNHINRLGLLYMS
ncbi:hypothetical protein E9993_16170 [Labilibacter sediminis]|nr:hypothetical protein E9993_16170 [Labilibacter sediminis]